MDESNICCIMNADFVLTNYSTYTNQESSSIIKLLIDLTTGMEILVHFSSLFIILNSIYMEYKLSLLKRLGFLLFCRPNKDIPKVSTVLLR